MVKVLVWIGDKALTLAKWFCELVGVGAGMAANELLPVFIVVSMIGVFISMAGFRRFGTKVSSISLLVYILLKVVL